MSSPPMATPKIRLKLSSSAVTSAAAPLSQTAATSSQLQQPEASSSTVPRRKQSPNGAPHGPSNVPSSSTQPHQLKTRIRLPRGAGMATATGAAYDSDDDEGAHALEEHAILRFPKNDPLADHFRQLVKARKELPVDTELTWKDARRGLFTFQGERLLAELCDLPCIIESQKTLDHKHFIKVADISQIIRLSRVPDAPTTTSSSGSDPVDAFFRADFPPETYVENSGITPPLKHVRLRRFRKRVNKRTVESIEREVARLLREDARALKVDLKQLDAVDVRGVGRCDTHAH